MTAKRKSISWSFDFLGLESSKALQKFAKKPFDLTKEEAITPARIHLYTAVGASLKLLFPFSRLNEPVLSALEQLASETQAIEKMVLQQSGEVVNFINDTFSENRPALHTALRDFFDSPNLSKEALRASEKAQEEHLKLKRWLDEVEKEQTFDTLVSVGIGGSHCGPRALYLALEPYWVADRTVHFLSNIDPDGATALFQKIDPKRTVWLIVSKSGSTLETKTNEHRIRQFYARQNLDPSHYLIAITDQESAMDRPESYKEVFYIGNDVGGRYSATSMVGGLLLSFATGYDTFYELLRGANTMDKVALRQNPNENLPLLLALLAVWNRSFLKLPSVAIVPYSQAMRGFPAYLQQLEMESNGKCRDREAHRVKWLTGPSVIGETGTDAQHSFFQWLHQGSDVISVELIGFLESQRGEDELFNGTTSQEKLIVSLMAQGLALAMGSSKEDHSMKFPGNRPSSFLIGKKLTPFTLGAIVSLYEHKAAFQGYLWNINPFDQEGVTLGKKLTAQFLEGERKGVLPIHQALRNEVREW